MKYNTDISENELWSTYPEAFSILLLDRTTGKNIYWATDSYKDRGDGYSFYDEITIDRISGENEGVIRPRASKTKEEQYSRTKDKAEVFTPSWICNKQNNLIDEAWFGDCSPFNLEVSDPHAKLAWATNPLKIPFPTPDGRTWMDYVLAQRIEITCGEAPYLVSRYDTTTGHFIDVYDRIGLLDRKLRVVSENTPSEPTKHNIRLWRRWAIRAFQATYGFEWQGDNLLIARESLLCTYIEHYKSKWGKEPKPSALLKIAEIISWNLWQMDGLTCGLPGYKSTERIEDFFSADIEPVLRLCRVKDWDYNTEPISGKEVIFKSLKH